MEAELAQATRENRLYLENVEKAKMHKGMQEKRNQKKRKHNEQGGNDNDEKEEDIRRSFRQRPKVSREVASQKAGEGKEAMGRLDESVKNVLSHVLGK